MDSEATDLYLMKINELIQDEDKILTFTSIASDFDIEINNAKSLLSQYLSDQRDLKSDVLAVTYIITGILKDNNQLTVCLVKEEDLTKKKNDFETISSEFIHSLQKSKNIDFNTITSINELNDAKAIAGSIVGKNCIKGELKVKKIEISPKDCKPIVTKTANSGSKPSLFAQCSNSEKLMEKPSTSKESIQNNQQPKQNQTKGKSAGGITSFFSKMPAKKEVKEVDKNGKEEEKPKDEKEKVKPKAKEEEMKSKDENKEKDSDAKKKRTENQPSQVLENEEMDVEDIIETTPKKAEESKPTKKRKKGNKEKEQQTKKRKRIQQICDSDSDDNMFGENENKLVEKSDEEDAPIFIKAPLAPKNKIRKAVDVTYEDDEGFIITKTEYVYEDAPEDEVKTEKPVESAVKQKVLEKKSSPNKVEDGVKSKGKKNAKKPVTGKQPTLMNFFKKA